MDPSTQADVVTALTTNVTPAMIYDTYISLLPWIGGLAVAGLTIYVVRKLIKGFRAGAKVRM